MTLMVMGPVLFIVGLALAAANFAAAWGLGQKARWAWVMTMVLAALYLSSICFPFGAVFIYALIRPDMRQRFQIHA